MGEVKVTKATTKVTGAETKEGTVEEAEVTGKIVKEIMSSIKAIYLVCRAGPI